jgi:hypothetical protein
MTQVLWPQESDAVIGEQLTGERQQQSAGTANLV